MLVLLILKNIMLAVLYFYFKQHLHYLLEHDGTKLKSYFQKTLIIK